MENLTSFKKVCDTLTSIEDGYRAEISDNWKQGRTVYGGLTMGLALEAAYAAVPDLPPLRSVMMNFVGPVTADPTFTVTVLRRGRNVTSVQVMATAEDKVVAASNFIFGTSRESILSVSVDAPNAPNPEDCKPVIPPKALAFLPKFAQQFEMNLIEGSRPISGAKEGYIRAWARHKDPASREGLSSFLAVSDILPPGAMPMLTKPGPTSSINFQLNLTTDNPVTADGWWHVETRMSTAGNGYSSQIMRFYNTSGEMVAEGIQAVATFV
ncbi:MAG: acyl-CoA thioesterase [Maricaulaceae bacterium]